uniref:Uncharacterized protein n=1 Tax=Arundo donax TaxID=35708 RepID=A0A0A8Z497_ARUDO
MQLPNFLCFFPRTHSEIAYISSVDSFMEQLIIFLPYSWTLRMVASHAQPSHPTPTASLSVC